MIRFDCCICGANLRTRSSFEGKVLPCPNCEQRIVVPPAAAKEEYSDSPDFNPDSPTTVKRSSWAARFHRFGQSVS